MNFCHFLGNLTRDPELTVTQGGKQVINFTVAVNRRYKKGDEMVKDTAFLDCEAWDTGAELINKYFVKGDPIIIHASIKQENWEDKTTGQKRSRLKFRVNQFDFVPGNRKGGGKDTEEPAPAPSSPSEEEIPF